MELTYREWWALIHGVVLGGLFLLAFAGGLAELYALRATVETPSGLRTSARRIGVGITSMAVISWLTVITGTWIVYPWYRDPSSDSPRSTLLADSATEGWHTFGMEWKEHIAWISPILATVAAFLVLYYGPALAGNRRLRRTTMVVFVGAFLAAGVAGLFGALITKAAPVA
ncbi:MAG TPA: hypothetical protein VFR23_16770 [Jiangellaceae bacterium]|nr:hypothetical protein [Jiangellaceae bacterium]